MLIINGIIPGYYENARRFSNGLCDLYAWVYQFDGDSNIWILFVNNISTRIDDTIYCGGLCVIRKESICQFY